MTRGRRILRRLAIAGAVVVGLAALLAAALAVAVLAWDYPAERLAPADATSLAVVARDGRVLRRVPLRGGGRQSWVTLDRVAAHLVSATIAAEDHRFFEHGGVDPVGVLRAAWLDARAGRAAYGASTLSMQLVRLVEPGRPRSPGSKLREAVLAMRLERALGKQAILEQYLNRAYYGNGAWGIGEAAERYFGKPAAALSLGEAGLLAVLPRGPSAYDPYRHLDRALERRRHVFDLMERRGLLGAGERRHAEEQPLELSREAPPDEAPHFVDAVLASLPPGARGRGGVIRTTLDLDLQRAVEREVRELLAARPDGERLDAGVVVLEPGTGAVRAMVGSADYRDPAAGQVNIVTTPREPGSTLKPFIYALALERGDTAATVVHDVADLPAAYRPTRDVREHGPARYREALAGSFNLAATRVLERVGVERLVERLARAGVSLPPDAAGQGPVLALGTAPVRLLDLAAAYGFLVNGGEVARPLLVLEPGAPRPSRTPLFSPEVAWIVMDMLADPDARRAVFGAELPLDLPFPVAAKTGTSSGFADTVTIAATREAIVAAWVGAFDGSGTRGTLAMWSAAPVVRAALLAVADGRPLGLPPPPPGLQSHPVCRQSGLRPGPGCPTKQEWFVPGTAPTRPCDWHRLEGGRLVVEYPVELRGTRWARDRARDYGPGDRHDAQNASTRQAGPAR